MEQYTIGIDIGGTKVIAALVNGAGHIVKRSDFATTVERGYKSILQELIHHVSELLAEFSPEKVVGIGIGMAGQISRETGVVHLAPNLQWKEVPLKEDLETALHLPVAITNDVRAAALGEWNYGAGKGCPDAVYIFVGTGIGGGIICNGEILSGHSNTAGEIGHIVVDWNGPLCHCGNYGCAEAYAGGWAIAAQAKESLRHNKYSKIRELSHDSESEITAKVVVEAARMGDQIAETILQRAEQALGTLAVNIIHAFNPKQLVFGGGVINGTPELIGKIEEYAKKRALRAALVEVAFTHSVLKSEAGAIGASCIARKLPKIEKVL